MTLLLLRDHDLRAPTDEEHAALDRVNAAITALLIVPVTEELPVGVCAEVDEAVAACRALGLGNDEIHRWWKVGP